MYLTVTDMEALKNRRIVVSRHGPPEVLELVEEDLPEPGAGEVRVRVLAAGVSAFDLIYRRWGRLPGSPPPPFSLGEDIVGVVDKTGKGVSSLEPGQTVAGGTWALGVGGGYADYVCLPAGELAAGGVGTALLQLGKLASLEMYGTASRHNHELVAALGATPIDYRTEDFVERIRSLAGDGVDVVVDTVGGAGQLWRSYRTLRKGGRLVWLGSAATNKKGLQVGLLSMLMLFLLKLIPDGKGVPTCPTLGELAKTHREWYLETLTELLDSLAAGRIRPVVAERIPLVEAARAHELLERSGHAGKMVLVAGV